MRKLSFIIVVMAALFMSCGGLGGEDDDSTPDNKPKTIHIGETFTDKQISVKAEKVRLVNGDIIVIDISITNNQAESVDYSSIWSWGELLTPANTQLETLSYIGNDEIVSFSGSRILPGATVKDVLAFKKYTPVAGKYTFYAEPPLPGDFDAEEMDDFLLEFDYSEINIPVKTAIEGRWYYSSIWGNQTYIFNYDKYSFRNFAAVSNIINTETGTFATKNDKIILDDQEEYGISYILSGNTLKLKYHYDTEYSDFIKQN
jgi:hypothetical protein